MAYCVWCQNSVAFCTCDARARARCERCGKDWRLCLCGGGRWRTRLAPALGEVDETPVSSELFPLSSPDDHGEAA